MEILKRLLDGPPQWTVAVAESLTVGRVQAALGAVSGASTFFVGGITAYTIDQKVRHLGVDRSAAEAYDSVSAAIARQMALGAGALFGSDFTLATTGYAEVKRGRDPGQPIAYWAIARRAAAPGSGYSVVKDGVLERRGLARVAMQEAAAAAVLQALVDWLRATRGGGV